VTKVTAGNLPPAILSRRVLGLFAKQPTPGQVKTRLAAQTSPQWAARVAETFLKDIVARLGNFAAQRVLAYAPAQAESYFADLVQGRFNLIPQAEGDLGQRMETFLAAHLKEGAQSVVLVGADSPTIPLAFIEQAFEELTQADLVLGPATDGGYYLLGCAGAVPPIFQAIAWGQPTVLRETIAQLTGSSVRLKLLSPWYDVDTLDDWRMLQGHLAALRRAGIDPELPNTELLIHE
jgi:rSAM/selenodomain-associated transferase 1